MPGTAVTYEVVRVAGSRPLAGGALRLLGSGVAGLSFRGLLVAVVGHHSFIANGCVDGMTFARFLEDFSIPRAAFGGEAARECDGLSGQRAVYFVHALYTGRRWTCILVSPWNFRFVVVHASGCSGGHDVRPYFESSARRSFLVKSVQIGRASCRERVL